ncbi:hypothetical protein [Phytoactinopolyspora mesophila]|uniref:ImmA/IrrE family metallo-endopeptidase n=1 Tax=Phytoactinopolyspora mesophila TaxID=2650750 RepID=A0A7K3LZW8_9ACTN|nr:hypothetical protein [Phytoactinopolyspora mesophila]NDL56559.1 hypothetical protein [Phytoactinopolyspora mesophila]
MGSCWLITGRDDGDAQGRRACDPWTPASRCATPTPWPRYANPRTTTYYDRARGHRSRWSWRVAAPAGLWEGLAAQVQAHGFQLVDADDTGQLGSTEGVTSFRDRTVTIRADRSNASRVKTLAYELAHIALGHEVRRADVHRGVREVEAEAEAMMVTACYGLEFSSDAVPYVAGWPSSVTDRNPVTALAAAGDAFSTWFPIRSPTIGVTTDRRRSPRDVKRPADLRQRGNFGTSG